MGFNINKIMKVFMCKFKLGDHGASVETNGITISFQYSFKPPKG